MTILITRPLPDGQELVSMLHTLGMQAYCLPLIKFKPGAGLKQLSYRINQLNINDIIFALSKQAIYHVNTYLKKNNIKWPSWIKYYAIGPKTGSILHQYSGHTIIYPYKQSNTERLIKMLNIKEIEHRRAIILQNKYGRTLLKQTLKRYGVIVHSIECYKIIFNNFNGFKIGEQLKKKIRILVITSGLILKQFYGMISISEKNQWILQCKIIVISDRIAILAKKLGWNDIQIIYDANNETILRFFSNIK